MILPESSPVVAMSTFVASVVLNCAFIVNEPIVQFAIFELPNVVAFKADANVSWKTFAIPLFVPSSL